jgi:secondary thiamine-phosphate synthase enzyme
MRITSNKKREIIDISELVSHDLQGNGVLNIFVAHTTAAVSIADLDPGTDADYLQAIEHMTPVEPWNHPHDPAHFPDHLWPTIIGNSLNIPYRNGRLVLGGWQRVILIELDGPRERTIELTTLAQKT